MKGRKEVRKAGLFSQTVEKTETDMQGELVELIDTMKADATKAGKTIFEYVDNPAKTLPLAREFLQALEVSDYDTAKELFASANKDHQITLLKIMLVNHVYNSAKFNNKHPLKIAINQFIKNYFQSDAAKYKTSAKNVFGKKLHGLTIVQWLAVLNECEMMDELAAQFPDDILRQVNYMPYDNPQMILAPLHIAAGYGFEEMTACLLKHRADPCIRTATGFKPIAVAAFRGYMNVVKLFRTDPTLLESRSDNGLTLMHHAVLGGKLEIVEYFHRLNVSLTECTTSNVSPVMFSLLKGHDEISAYLYKHGAKGHKQDKRGNSPLHYACLSKKLSSLKLALENHPDCLNIPNKIGMTPLLAAIDTKFTEGAEFLLESGCDFRARTAFDFEALHIAATTDNVEVVEALLKRGVEYTTKAVVLLEKLNLFLKPYTPPRIKFLEAMGEKDSVQLTAEQIAECYGAKNVAELLRSKRRVDEEFNSFTMM